jgi:hypothetical protein
VQRGQQAAKACLLAVASLNVASQSFAVAPAKSTYDGLYRKSEVLNPRIYPSV